MKPIESDLMEQDNPRVYRLVLTGGESVTKIAKENFPREFLIKCCVENGKSRGFLTQFILRNTLSSCSLSLTVAFRW